MDGLLGLPVKESRRAMRKPRSFVASWLIRFGVLYTLYMILVGCPTVPNEADPAVCHRYYDLKRIAVKHVAPHVQPYYEQYASPYIAKGEPFYHQANELYKQADIYARPAAQKTHKLYRDNLHPYVDRGYVAGKSIFDDKVGRHIYQVYDEVEFKARRAWYQYAGRHIDSAGTHYSRLVAPHLDQAKLQAQQVWHKALVPSYNKAKPHAIAAARQGAKHYHTHVHPQVLKLWRAIKHFVNTRIMPTIRRYYYLYIDPQVSRITDKVFQFQAQRGFSDHVTVDGDTLSASVSASIVEEILSTSTLLAKTTVIAGETIEESTPEPTIDAATEQKIENEVIERLVEQAKTGIRAEADASLAALEEQLDEILPQLVRKEEMICQDYLLQLESISVSEVEGVEQRILSLASHLTNKGRDLEEIGDELRPYFVRAGKAIHREAVEVKAHLVTVMDSLDSRVRRSTAAVYRGLNEHAARLRSEPEEKIKLGASARSYSRELAALERLTQDVDQELRKLAQAKVSAYSVPLQTLLRETEVNVEKLAGGAAAKLQTLHSVGPRKIQLNDQSHDFGHGYKPVAAMLGAQALYEQVSAAVVGTATDEPVPLASQVFEGAADAIRHATDAVVDALDPSSVAAAATAAASIVADQAQQAATAIREKAEEIDRDEIVATLSSVAAVATEQAAAAYAEASAYLEGIDTADLKTKASVAASVLSENAAAAASSASSAASVAGEHGASVASLASEAIIGTPPSAADLLMDKIGHYVRPEAPGMTDRIAEAVQEAYDHLQSEASAAKAHITDYAADFAVNQDRVHFAKSKASEVVVAAAEQATGAADALKQAIVGSHAGKVDNIVAQASEALLGKDQGVVESALSRASDAATRAAVQISEAVVGQQQGTVESIVSQATAVAAGVVQQASEAILGKNQGVVESALSRANEAAAQATDAAITAGLRLSDAVLGKDQGPVESVLSRASKVADEAVAQASQAIVGKEPGILQGAVAGVSSAAAQAASAVAPIVGGLAKSADVDGQTAIVPEAVASATDKVKHVAEQVRQHIEL